ncbi:MAG: DEAD/DEAH box helicase [Planctomycetaceae bacterium]|nr:DEAD/DEAH box helicase [Planctomycetaceae bacterium]
MSSKTFADLGLCAPLLEALEAEKYTTPTPIQAEAIPHVLAGRDLMGCAQTGTGKTAAFALPILQRLNAQNRRAIPKSPNVLVLSPTRELASQIAESFHSYGRNVRTRQTVIFGGVGQGPQVRAMVRGVHTVIATPGRLCDLMEQRHIFLDKIEMFVLDEADRMLDMGFLPALKQIIGALGPKRQSLFFTATMPPAIAELAGNLLQDPVRISVTPQSTPVERIEQRVLFVERKQKRTLLLETLNKPEARRVLVFTRTKRGANELAERLSESGVQSNAIHGNKSQAARERALNGFRSGRVRVLVATDLAARGIDVDGITHVVNYDLPIEPECYVHRIGRTGRAGASGIALTFCDATERSMLRSIERIMKMTITVDDNYPASKLAGAEGGGDRPFRGPGQNGRRPQGKRPFGSRRFGGGGGKPGGPRPKRQPATA